MLQNYDIEISEFLSLTNAGLKVADFVQIKAAIIKRYKEVYGQDIDVSTATADGVFINDLALIMNNILKTVSTMYANLDVNFASGEYLSSLCRLANISRRPATKSIASIKLVNNADVPTVIPAKTVLFDKSGQAWTSTEQLDFTLEAYGQQGSQRTITVECNEIGQVEAPAGYISSLLDASLNVEVIQDEAAIVGSLEETDDELRERRAQSNGSSGVTVLESLYGALRETSGIQDVKIYNNVLDTPNSDLSKDETSILPHSIYVIIRLQELVNVPDSTIGSIIFNKLTPGISTSQSIDENCRKDYDFTPSVIGTSLDIFTQKIHWKQAKGLHEDIKIEITPTQYFDKNSSDLGKNDTFGLIGSEVMNYLNSLPIGKTVEEFDIKLTAINADPTFKASATYFVGAITLPENINDDNYYNYTTMSVEEDSNESGKYIITLS